MENEMKHSNVVDTIIAMINVIPDGNANMRGSVEFLVNSTDAMALVPWLNQWNEEKQGFFNGVWSITADREGIRIIFLSTGM